MKKQKVEPKKTTFKRKAPRAKKLACVDLFCGCGGMSLGFTKAGFEVKAGFELWEPAICVYKANFKHPIIKQDLSALDEAIPKIAEYKPDLIVGGPPCQDFSTAGHQDESLGRAILSVYYSQIVSAIRPKYFVMENVANIQNSKAFKKVDGLCVHKRAVRVHRIHDQADGVRRSYDRGEERDSGLSAERDDSA